MEALYLMLSCWKNEWVTQLTIPSSSFAAQVIEMTELAIMQCFTNTTSYFCLATRPPQASLLFHAFTFTIRCLAALFGLILGLLGGRILGAWVFCGCVLGARSLRICVFGARFLWSRVLRSRFSWIGVLGAGVLRDRFLGFLDRLLLGWAVSFRTGLVKWNGAGLRWNRSWYLFGLILVLARALFELFVNKSSLHWNLCFEHIPYWSVTGNGRTIRKHFLDGLFKLSSTHTKVLRVAACICTVIETSIRLIGLSYVLRLSAFERPRLVTYTSLSVRVLCCKEAVSF